MRRREVNIIAEKRDLDEFNLVMEQLDVDEQVWGASKSSMIDKEVKEKSRELGPASKSMSMKREQKNARGARNKKLKYATMEK